MRDAATRWHGIVLDLDDTIFETTRLLIPWADERAVDALVAAGLRMERCAALARIRALRAAGTHAYFLPLAAEGGLDEASARRAEDAWYDYDPPAMDLSDGARRALDELAALAPLALLTSGHPETQRRKVARLGIGSRFADAEYVPHRGTTTKREALGALLARRGWEPSRTVVAGDRPDSDVRAANRNGCRSILVRTPGGEFERVPAEGGDAPWRTVRRLAEVPPLLS